jgi:hypothetical protein
MLLQQHCNLILLGFREAPHRSRLQQILTFILFFECDFNRTDETLANFGARQLRPYERHRHRDRALGSLLYSIKVLLMIESPRFRRQLRHLVA